MELEAVKSVAINESDNVLMKFECVLRDAGHHYAGWYTLPEPPPRLRNNDPTEDSTGAFPDNR